MPENLARPKLRDLIPCLVVFLGLSGTAPVAATKIIRFRSLR